LFGSSLQWFFTHSLACKKCFSHADLFSHWKHFFSLAVIVNFFFLFCAATATIPLFVSFWFEKYLAYFIGQHSSRCRRWEKCLAFRWRNGWGLSPATRDSPQFVTRHEVSGPMFWVLNYRTHKTVGGLLWKLCRATRAKSY